MQTPLLHASGVKNGFFRVVFSPRGLAACALLLAACSPPLDGPALRLNTAASWQQSAPDLPRLMTNRAWWQGFEDPVLDQLIARAFAASPDLAAAQARLEAADRALAALPSVLRATPEARLQQDFGTQSQALRSTALLELVIDPGGDRAALALGAEAEARAAQASRDLAELLLIERIADSYLLLRHAQAELRLQQAEADRIARFLAQSRKLAEAGESTEIDLARLRARQASLQAGLPAPQATIQREALRLSVLAGDAPGLFPADLSRQLHTGRAQPVPRQAADMAIPADLLRNRPDLRLAAARYDSARADLGRARAVLYPQLSLSGTIELRHMSGQQGTTGNFGPVLRLPSLPTAPARAGITAAEARLRAAYSDWQAAALQALYEVESGLLDYQATSRAETEAVRAARFHREATRLLAAALEQGETTFAEILVAETEAGLAETQLAQARLARARAFIQLNLSLGSGA